MSDVCEVQILSKCSWTNIQTDIGLSRMMYYLKYDQIGSASLAHSFWPISLL